MSRSFRTLNELLQGNPFTLVDVGAAGGVHKRWRNLGGLLRVVGFEPDDQAFRKLHATERELWFNVALSSRRERRALHITKAQTNTSFLAPNQQLLRQLQWSPGEPVTDHDIVRDVDVECEALDAVLKKEKIRADFLKLDTQGSELDILRGAERVLADDIVIAEIEVEFAPIYIRQPLFADVDSFMRDKGFVLQDLGNFLYMKPRGLAGIGGAKGRIIAADALYVRDFSQDYKALYERGVDRVRAAIAGYAVYGYPELGINLLQKLSGCGCAIARADELVNALRGVRPYSLRFPGMERVAKKCKKVWLRHRKVSHCLWDVPLGN